MWVKSMCNGVTEIRPSYTAFRSAPSEPKTLLGQLKASGVLVAPIGKGPVQKLIRYAGDGAGGFQAEVLCEVRFVPLLDGVAREL